MNETYNTSTLRSAKTAKTANAANATNTEYTTSYNQAFTGNGYDHMNIHLVKLNDLNMLLGDEIGIFDGSICVGSAFCNEEALQKNVLSINVSRDDQSEMLPNGFTNGHQITLKVVRDGSKRNLDFTVENDATATFETGKSLLLSTKAPMDVLFAEKEQSITCYPSPFNESLNVLIKNPTGKQLTVCIYDLVGRKVKTLYDGIDSKKQLTWNGASEAGNNVAPGLYFVHCNGVMTQTVIKK